MQAIELEDNLMRFNVSYLKFTRFLTFSAFIHMASSNDTLDAYFCE